MKKFVFLATITLTLLAGILLIASPDAEAGTCPVPSLEICMDICYAQYDFCTGGGDSNDNCWPTLQSCKQMCLDNCS